LHSGINVLFGISLQLWDILDAWHIPKLLKTKDFIKQEEFQEVTSGH